MHSSEIYIENKPEEMKKEEFKPENCDEPRQVESFEESVCPDGGWGWVVLVAALFIRIICGGLLVTFGIFVTPLVNEYKTSQSTVSWIASLMSALNLASTPLATLLAIKCSNRTIVIIGSLLAGIMFAAPFFYSPLWFMFLSSALTGVGMGIIIMSTTVVLTNYFDKKLSIVNGIFTSGTGIASFIITPIFDKLVSLYGWKISMLIYGMLFFFCGLCSLAYKVIPKKSVKLDVSSKSTEMNDVDKTTKIMIENENEIQKKESRIQAFLSVTNMCPVQYSNLDINKKWFCSMQQIKSKIENNVEKECNSLLSNLPVSALLGMSISNGLNNKEQDVIKEEDNSIQLDKKEISIWKNYVFIIFVLANFLTNLGHDTTFIYVKQRSIDMGVTESRASFLLIAIGIGNTLGRLIFGYLGSKGRLQTYGLYCVSLILAGGVLLFSRVAFTYPLMLVYTIVFGLFIGSYTTLTAVVLLNIVGIRNFTKGLGMVYFVQAIGLLLCSPISGFIFDSTKSYHWSFITSGSFILLSGLLLLAGFASKSFRKSQLGSF